MYDERLGQIYLTKFLEDHFVYIDEVVEVAGFALIQSETTC